MNETLEETIARIKRKWPEAFGLPRINSVGPEGPKAQGAEIPGSEAGKAVFERPGRPKDGLANVEAPDWRMKAAGDDWDGAEDVEDPPSP